MRRAEALVAVVKRQIDRDIRELRQLVADPYDTHYQQFEFGIFGTVLGATVTLLVLDIFRSLFVVSNTDALSTRVMLFVGLTLGFIVIAGLLASAFDNGYDRGIRRFLHIVLYVFVPLWCGFIYYSPAYVSLAKQQDTSTTQLFIWTIFLLATVWPPTHVIFRWLGRQSFGAQNAL
jgi:hypothetical protein